MKIKLFFSLEKLFVLVFMFCTLLGCAPKTITLPEDTPLSEFMLGEWKVISRVNTNTGETLEIVFPKISISRETISYGDTYRAEYNFTSEDTIFLDNQRLTGGETWQLERNKEYLIVYQEFQNFKTTMKLRRSK